MMKYTEHRSKESSFNFFSSSSLCLDGVKDFSILSSSNSNASKNSFLSSLSLSLSALHHHSSSQYVLFTIVGLSWLLNGRAEQRREQRGVLFVEYHEFENWNCSSLHHHRRRVLCTMKTTTTRNDEKIIFLVFDVLLLFAALCRLCEQSNREGARRRRWRGSTEQRRKFKLLEKDFFLFLHQFTLFKFLYYILSLSQPRMMMEWGRKGREAKISFLADLAWSRSRAPRAGRSFGELMWSSQRSVRSLTFRAPIKSSNQFSNVNKMF